jgi:hypothetical protein
VEMWWLYGVVGLGGWEQTLLPLQGLLSLLTHTLGRPGTHGPASLLDSGLCGR